MSEIFQENLGNLIRGKEDIKLFRDLVEEKQVIFMELKVSVENRLTRQSFVAI